MKERVFTEHGPGEVTSGLLVQPTESIYRRRERVLKERERMKKERITSETGGQKDRKPQRMELLPPKALLALSEIYAHGGEKYEDDNYLRGYDWSLAYGAMQRHLNLWQGGEDIDPESGKHHLLHAAWHALTLYTFQQENLGTDDRFATRLREQQNR